MIEHFDQVLFQSIFGLGHRWEWLDNVMVVSARHLPYFLVLGLIFALVQISPWRRRLFYTIGLALTMLLSRGIITETIHFFYHRPRPFVALGFEPLISQDSGGSFPSGHAALFFALAMGLWYMNRRWGVTYLILALLNGFARIFVGVHYPLDVLGGALIGIGSAYIVHLLLRSYEVAHEGEGTLHESPEDVESEENERPTAILT